MNADLYEQFVSLKELGRKAEAKIAVDLFIASFGTAEEIKSWVFAFLETEFDRYRIRHEIYEKLVYPVLLDGYLKNDANCTAWLAKTIYNFYELKEIHSSLKNKGVIQLFEEAYNLDPNEDVRSRFLESWIAEFDYSQHEWPAGILDGINGTDIKGCEQILQEVESVRNLDTQNKYQDYLFDYEAKVREYIVRLRESE